jgi:tetratricopeptide (TPR) repeat protein
LITLGRLYQTQNDYKKARQLLGRAHELARGLDDPALRAKAACALGSAIALGPGGARAEALIAEAEALLPEGPEFAPTRIFCLICGSDVARDRDDGRKSLARIETARRLLAEAKAPSPELELTVALEHANSLRYAGQSRQAIPAFEAVFARLVALGREDTERAVTVLNNWAVTLERLGRPLEAERLYRRALHTDSADGSFERASPNVLTNLAKTQIALHHLRDAGVNAEKAHLKALRIGHERVIASALLLRAAVYRETGDLRRAGTMLADSEARMKRIYPPGHGSHAAIASERSLQAAARGDLATAMAEADRAITLTEASVRGPGTARGRYLRRRSELALALGRPEQAEADAAASLREVAAECGPEGTSSDRGLAELSLGRAQAARGKTAEARAAFTSAHALLVPTLGERHPDTLTAARLAGPDLPADGVATRPAP